MRCRIEDDAMKAILILITAFTWDAFGQDVRNTSWGMSVEQVKQVETADLIRQTHHGRSPWDTASLAFNVTIMDKPAVLHYSFVNNQMSHVMYLFKAVGAADTLYIDLGISLSEKHQAEIVDVIRLPQHRSVTYKSAHESISFTITWSFERDEIWVFVNNDILKALHAKAKGMQRASKDGL